MKRLVALAAVAVAGVCVAAERSADYAALAPIAASSPDGLQRLQLPLDVLQQSRSPQLADVRVFNANDESLPLAFVAPRAEAPSRAAPLPLFVWPARAARPGASGRIQVQVDAAGAVVRVDGVAEPPPARANAWLIDASARRDDERLAGLSLEWDRVAEGLNRGATLEGSDDLAQWHTLARATLIEMTSAGGATIRRDRIDLEAVSVPKYLKLRVDDGLPLRAVHAQWRSTAQLPLDRASVVFERADAASGVWQFDLRAALNLKRLKVELPQPNTVFVATLEQRNDGDADWRIVGRHTLYRLTRGGEEMTSPPIEPNAAAARHWRLKLDAPADASAPDTLAATIEWPQTHVVFVARGPAPLQLAVGRERTKPSALAVETLIPGYRPGAENELPRAAVSLLVVQPHVEPSWAERWARAAPEDKRRWLLWLVLAGAVAGLAWLARGLLKDVTRDA